MSYQKVNSDVCSKNKIRSSTDGMLTKQQRQVLIGILLGDAHAEMRSDSTCRIKIEQSTKHQAYVEHLYLIFQDWVSAAPRRKTRNSDGRNQNESISFQTVSHAAFRFYAHQFYVAGKKHVPRLIHRWLTPQALAYWFMDDGSIKSKQSKGVLLNTQGFSKSDVRRLIEVLQTKFGLQCSLRKQREGPQIYVSGKSYETFVELVEPFLIDEMRYKLPPPRSKDS